MGLLIIDDGIVNWGEHTEDEETNHALMAFSSSSVPHPLSGDYTPKPQEEIDESFAESIGTSSEHMVNLKSEISRVPQEVYVSKPITTIEKDVSAPKSKEVKPSCATHVKTHRQQMKNQGTSEVKGKNWNKMMERELGEGYSFIKKKCFVCDSLSQLIKDCDYYEKKMAREGKFKKQRVFNTVQLNSVRPRVNTINSTFNTVRSIQPVPTRTSNSFCPKKPQGKRGTAVKISAGYNWRNSSPNSNCDSGPTFIRTDHPLKNMVDRDTLSLLGKFDGKSEEGFLVDKPNVKGVGYRWMFDIDYLTDSVNYIPVSLENQANPHAGSSEVTNSTGTSQTPNSDASKEKDEDAELIIVPSAVKNTEEKVDTRKSSTNSKKEEILTEPLHEKEASSTGTSEDNPKILAFRRELEEIAQKHSGNVPENNSTSTLSVNSGSAPVNTGGLDPDDSAMPELEIFHKPETRIFDEPFLYIQILGVPKSAVQTRSKVQQKSGAHALVSYIQKQQRNNHKDQQHCLFAYFLSEEPKKIFEALQDDSWVQAMQEELLQFRLQQPDESAGFAEIVDFLRGSNLMYALTTNPTIYDSLVKQFWQTATANTLADGTLELQATIDTIVYTITEASIRTKLHLEDVIRG
ncbi:hypothetical protein Tco_1019955 [Tanacetum coccineum]|uniref:Uncharacterized protein n=1 Tax=Tanacetum coccineum TaxID=301880 RepID=A0ABQ5G028_9ASTR